MKPSIKPQQDEHADLTAGADARLRGWRGESGHNLIPGELIVFLDVFDLVPGGKSTEYSCDVDSCTLDAGFAEAHSPGPL